MSESIEYHRFPRGDHCTFPGCPAKRYYYDSGRRICRLGHEQEGFTQIQEDEDDFGTQGRVTRKKREEKEKVEKVLRGRQARELYVLCWQLILWKQVSWLVRKRGCPEELETVVRDLWSLRLGDITWVDEVGDEGGDESSGQMGFSSQGDSGRETGDTTDDESSVSGEMDRRRRTIARDKGMPRLIDTLAFCYLGALLMRLPIGIGDLHRWATEQEIVYFHAIKEIPNDMRARLPGQYHGAFEARTILPEGHLYFRISKLMVSLNDRHELVFPPVNAPLITFTQVKSLCLPLNVYAAAHRLGKLLSFDYQYPAKLMRLSFAFYPEVQVIALIMIATKLCYPFDNIPRLPETFDDPATIKLDWSKWQEIVRDPAVEGFSKGEQAKVEDKDVLSMSEKKLDEYLDWYQRTWIDDRDPKISQQLLDLFPLEDLPQEVDTASTPKGQQVEEDRLKRMVQSLSWQKPRRRDKSGEPIANRPGSDYPRYRSVEELPEAAKLLFAKAAKSAGLTSDMMVRAVYSIERALFDWIMNERRQKFQRKQELRPDMEAPDESDDELMSDDEMVERLGLV